MGGATCSGRRGSTSEGVQRRGIEATIMFLMGIVLLAVGRVGV